MERRAKAVQEIEVKLAVASRAEALRRLRTAGARMVRSVHEHNTLFDTPTAALRKRGNLLRLRVETPRGGGRQRCVVTFKGPSQTGSKYKVREEQEFEVKSAANTQFLLQYAGLDMRPVFRYEKFRTTFRLRGLPRLHIELDEVPFGVFLELEGAPRAIDSAARKLGFGPGDYITKSYLALHADGRRRRGLPLGNMLFPPRKKAGKKRGDA